MLQTLGETTVLPIPRGRPIAERDTFPAMRIATSLPPRFGVEECKLDRRCAIRIPIEQDVRYKVSTRNTVTVGYGKAVNMSSNGLLFSTEKPLAVGAKLEVAVNWPALLDNKCPLKLVTTGRVVRSESGLAAIEIERYEFRTQGVHRMV